MRVALLISAGTAEGLALASRWAVDGNDVTVVLLDAAAAAARPMHCCAGAVEQALEAGIAVTAHDDALRRRALSRADLVEGVKPIDLETVADLAVDGADRVVWL